MRQEEFYPMPIVAPPPAGSLIEIRDAADGLELRMPPPMGWARWIPALFIIFWLGGWGIGEVVAAYILATVLQDGPGGGGGTVICVFLSAWLALWTYGGIAAFQAAATLVRAKPERLVLSAEELDFDLGVFGDRKGLAALAGRGLRPEGWSRVPQGKWPRSEIDSISIVFGRHGPKLVVRRGNEQTLLGWQLGEPELEWLRDLLLAWRGGKVWL